MASSSPLSWNFPAWTPAWKALPSRQTVPGGNAPPPDELLASVGNWTPAPTLPSSSPVFLGCPKSDRTSGCHSPFWAMLRQLLGSLTGVWKPQRETNKRYLTSKSLNFPAAKPGCSAPRTEVPRHPTLAHWGRESRLLPTLLLGNGLTKIGAGEVWRGEEKAGKGGHKRDTHDRSQNWKGRCI